MFGSLPGQHFGWVDFPVGHVPWMSVDLENLYECVCDAAAGVNGMGEWTDTLALLDDEGKCPAVLKEIDYKQPLRSV